MQNIEDVSESLNSQSLRVCVIGIGRIGLPTALSFAKAGLQTIGVDINEELVQKINPIAGVTNSISLICF